MLNRYQSDVEEIVGVRQRSDIWFSREPLTPENRDEIAYNAALTALAGIEPDAALREDLLQECMIKYLKYFPDFKASSVGQFAAWMSKIAKNTHSNHWRNQRCSRRDVSRNKLMSDLTSQEKESGTRKKYPSLWMITTSLLCSI